MDDLRRAGLTLGFRTVCSLLIAACSACKEPPPAPPQDLATPPAPTDLSGPPPDLATPDLATPDLATPKGCTRQAPGPERKYVTSDITLPSGAMTFGIDIDGDGKADNQLAKVFGVIGSQIDLQGPVTAEVKSGALLLGVAVRAQSLTSACAAVDTVPLRRPAQPPRFDGSDQLSAAADPPAALYGAIGDPLPDAPTGNPPGQLTTVLPSRLSAADSQTLVVNLPFGVGDVPLRLQGVHVQARIDDKGLLSGQLHGAISQTDVDSKIIPAVAGLLTAVINADPNSSTSRTIIQLFEDQTLPASRQKCMVAADCCAISPTTCKIIPAEVKAQPLIGNFLTSDVQVFDAAGGWSPVPRGANKNGLSVGLGFTGVRASF